ncbi:DUF4037 domain-containing protein [Reinekea marina]|uniref:DUF4037 domain-containing protein n=1 Tax=Reinekea marina TaxID=1310421 RepID=A0ABV7WPP8_9GAMM
MQETLWVIQNGVVLKNSELLEKWRSTIQYPRSIQAKIVESHLEVITSCDLQLHAHRGDVALLFGLISGMQKRIVYLLFALNGSFSIGTKNMAKSLSAFEIKPRDTWLRFQEAYKAHLSSCVEETELLIDEVVELVQEHLPEVSVTELNRFQAFRRSAWSPTI